MLCHRLLRNSRRLRESYIEISNYFRGQSRQSSHGHLRCLRSSASPRSLSTSSPGLPGTVEGQPVESGDNITKGFPSPPESGFVNNLSRDDEFSNAQTIVEKQDTGRPKRTSLPTREFLAAYKRRHNLVSDASPWDFLVNFREPPDVSEERKVPVKFYGYITTERKVKGLSFLIVADPYLRRSVQVVHTRRPKSTAPRDQAHATSSRPGPENETPGLDNAKDGAAEEVNDNDVNSTPGTESFRPHEPVLVSGYVVRREVPLADANRPRPKTMRNPFIGLVEHITHLEIQSDSIVSLNTMPRHVLASTDTKLSPSRRHLQFRIDDQLRIALRTRSKVMAMARKFLFMKGFDEMETPLLFKSTPEGAREFIVPTRTKGMAYALPQSPQQYKQLLMASGIPRYFQFAKCFRDEDMRADRQPEFTQLDLEMSFARREDVMIIIERLVAQSVWPSAANMKPFEKELWADPPFGATSYPPDARILFSQYTYHQAMSMYGSDKPDPRLGSEIHRVEHWVPKTLQQMLSSLENPVIEILKVDMQGQDPRTTNGFVTEFFDAASSAIYMENPAGAPGLTVCDPKKPLHGLGSFGHEGAAMVEELLEPQAGDIILIQARPDIPFTGGSTPLGNLRRDIHQAAAAQGLRGLPKDPSFIWVTDFPLFSPIEADAPGQEGGAGICSTHHPFTAPRPDQDLMKLFTDPLSVIGDHYDLVINGVEVGGGSRRIHDAQMQELIFSDVLRMKKNRIEDFRHLLDALRSGCPPHAGFALGFDRLMALALGRASVRDVIAFPKWGATAEDKLVGSPSKMSSETLSTYHLKIKDKVAENDGREGAARDSMK